MIRRGTTREIVGEKGRRLLVHVRRSHPSQSDPADPAPHCRRRASLIPRQFRSSRGKCSRTSFGSRVRALLSVRGSHALTRRRSQDRTRASASSPRPAKTTAETRATASSPSTAARRSLAASSAGTLPARVRSPRARSLRVRSRPICRLRTAASRTSAVTRSDSSMASRRPCTTPGRTARARPCSASCRASGPSRRCPRPSASSSATSPPTTSLSPTSVLVSAAPRASELGTLTTVSQFSLRRTSRCSRRRACGAISRRCVSGWPSPFSLRT